MGNVSVDLIAAAERVIDANGLAGATLELIAKEAGVNRVTLYRKGLNAESLTIAAISNAIDEYAAVLLPAMSHVGTGRARLEMLLRALCEVAEQHLGLLASLYDLPTALFHLPTGDDTARMLTRLDFTDPIARVLEDGIRDGSLRSDDTQASAELVFNAVGWTYIHMRRTHGSNAIKICDELTALFLNGLST